VESRASPLAGSPINPAAAGRPAGPARHAREPGSRSLPRPSAAPQAADGPRRRLGAFSAGSFRRSWSARWPLGRSSMDSKPPARMPSCASAKAPKRSSMASSRGVPSAPCSSGVRSCPSLARPSTGGPARASSAGTRAVPEASGGRAGPPATCRRKQPQRNPQQRLERHPARASAPVFARTPRRGRSPPLAARRTPRPRSAAAQGASGPTGSRGAAGRWCGARRPAATACAGAAPCSTAPGSNDGARAPVRARRSADDRSRCAGGRQSQQTSQKRRKPNEGWCASSALSRVREASTRAGPMAMRRLAFRCAQLRRVPGGQGCSAVPKPSQESSSMCDARANPQKGCRFGPDAAPKFLVGSRSEALRQQDHLAGDPLGQVAHPVAF
jgi:hypothetical protein